jgi:TP901 family phage tail tape measure protein
MDVLREAAIEAGADTAFSATEAAQGIEELAKAGVSTTDILNGGLAGALDLAAAGGVSVEEAAESAASALTQFGLSGEDVPHVADLLAAAAGKAQGGVTDMSQALSQAGLVASNSGLSIEETTGVLAAFASAGLIGSDAGTSFKSMLQRLQNPSKESAQLMEELGISMYDANGNMVGMSDLAGQLKSKLGGLTQAQRDAALAQIFGSDAVRAATVLYNQGSEGISNWTSEVDESGYAAETAAARQDNLAGSWEKLTGSAETLAISIGEKVTPALKWLVDGATAVIDSIDEIPDPILAVATGLGGIATAGALAGGAFLTLAPRVWDTYTAITSLKATFPTFGSHLDSVTSKTGKFLGKLTKVTGALGVFYGTMRGVQALSTAVAGIERTVQGVEQLQNRLDAAASSGESFYNAVVKSIGDINTEQFTDLAESLERVAQPGWADKLASITKLDATGFNDVVDQFDVLNEQISTLAGSDVSKATDQFAALLEEAGGTKEAFENLKTVLPDYVEEMYALANANGVTIDDTNELALLTGGLSDQFSATSDSANGTSTAIDSVTDAAEDAADAMDEYIQGLEDAAGIGISLSEAQIGWQQAIADATAALQENGQTLDITTEAGRNNQSALNDMASSAWDLVTSLYEVDGASADLEGTMQTARNAFIQTAIQMGMTQAEAGELADKYGLIPGNVRTNVIANTWQASSAIDQVAGQLSSLPTRKTITVDVLQYYSTYGESVYSASGGTGGNALHRAGGGAIYGPGTATSDSILARLSTGEHVLTASDVQKIGGQSAVYRLRAAIQAGMVRFADGGTVGGSSLVSPKVMVSTTPAIYVQNPFTGKYLLAQVDQRAENVAVDVVNAR